MKIKHLKKFNSIKEKARLEKEAEEKAKSDAENPEDS